MEKPSLSWMNQHRMFRLDSVGYGSWDEKLGFLLYTRPGKHRDGELVFFTLLGVPSGKRLHNLSSIEIIHLSMGFSIVPGLVNIQQTMENDPFFNG